MSVYRFSPGHDIVKHQLRISDRNPAGKPAGIAWWLDAEQSRLVSVQRRDTYIVLTRLAGAHIEKFQ